MNKARKILSELPLRVNECSPEMFADLYWLASKLLELDKWASSMPDADFHADDPRWDWWHDRPRIEDAS